MHDAIGANSSLTAVGPLEQAGALQPPMEAGAPVPKPMTLTQVSRRDQRRWPESLAAGPGTAADRCAKCRANPMDSMTIPQGTGSGFIWDNKGHVVTNYHVVKGAAALQVCLPCALLAARVTIRWYQELNHGDSMLLADLVAVHRALRALSSRMVTECDRDR